MLTRITIVVERTRTSYAAYAPDVPGCGATGRSVDEVVTHMGEALMAFLPLMYAAGDTLPAHPSDPREIMPLARGDQILDLMLPIHSLNHVAGGAAVAA